ncbi:unnamed protein product [Calicophoron daubneyi]|uniref:3-hydroxyisobutyryl-CoA hydrolase, mitochondrial n=1 Tax=Calicophoron daubneyi TaxID=300641 RepID=A0AAV2T3K2_CALDB
MFKVRATCEVAFRRSFSTKGDDAVLTRYKSCGVITLNRPGVHNALTLHMIRRILPTLKEWDEDRSISHIIIEGSGKKAFCSGGDVRSIAQAAAKGDALAGTFFREEYHLDHLTGTLSKPFVALIDGITMGGGVGVSVHGRYRVATENTMFAMPETAIGLFPDVGGGYFLPRLPHPGLGAFLGLTGYRLRGKDVVWAGVGTHFRSAESIEQLKEDLVNLEFPKISESSDVEKIDRVISEKLGNGTGNFQPPEPLAEHMNAIGHIFSLFDGTKPATIESILLKLSDYSKKNEACSRWANKQIELLRFMSPMSLKVTLRQLQRGSSLSFTDDFKMEFRLSQHFVRSHDFPEGVRAALIDKDNRPVWKPNSLSSITDDDVNNCFTLLEGLEEWQPYRRPK